MAPKMSFLRLKSDVNATDKSGRVYKEFQVWCSKGPAIVKDPELMFVRCQVVGKAGNVLKLKQLEPEDPSGSVIEAKPEDVFNLNMNIDPMVFPDIGMIPHTNPAAVLDFLRCRYYRGQIYTLANPLLVAINPFKDLGNTTDKVIKQYRDAHDVEKLPPHVFTVAREAVSNLHSVMKSQTIIVSGESGAGKTEATKQVMRYFAAAKSGITDTRIQTAVLAANPVLEAFGNAKTIRNNNSSRFGRFMQLQVAKMGGIEYGSVQNFLLEKSRILMQESEERCYHIFYQLLKGASSQQKQRYHLLPLDKYTFINPKCTEATGINDIEEWRDVQESLDSMRMTQDEKDAIFSIVSGVILLGNVKVEVEPKQGVHDAAAIKGRDRDVFLIACKLLFLDPGQVEEALTVKISMAGKSEIRGYWSQVDADMLKKSLSKAMYDKLFSWIIRRLNTHIEPARGFAQYIGMLDIFGFEVFKHNSLEQLFINITNEILQKNFIDAVFDRETKLYRAEGISSADLVWTSNDEVIDMLTAKKSSFMALLEDQCLGPKGSDEGLLSAAYLHLKDNPKFVKPKTNFQTTFRVDHTIGEIPYNVSGFLEKNKDVLRPDLVMVAQRSHNPVTAGMFEGLAVERGKLAKGQLIGSQFLNQLHQLMGLINATEPHFIRCVKPNESKKPLDYVPARVLTQLHSLSILEALQLRNLGYSYRRPFTEFLTQYRFVDVGIVEDKKLDPRTKCEMMLKRSGMKEGWQIGKTMVFMKPQCMKDMQRKQRDCLAAWEPLEEVIRSLMTRQKLKRDYKRRSPHLVRVQAHCRKRLNGRVAAPSFERKVAGWC